MISITMSLTKDSFRNWLMVLLVAMVAMVLLDILLVSTLNKGDTLHRAIHHKDTLHKLVAIHHKDTLHMVVAILHKAIRRLDILLVNTHQLLIPVHQLLIQGMEAWGQC